VREGDTVNAGDTIAILDDAQIRAREDQARDALRRQKQRASPRRNKSPSFKNNYCKADCR